MFPLLKRFEKDVFGGEGKRDQEDGGRHVPKVEITKDGCV